MSDSKERWINNVPLLGKMLAAFGLVFLCFLATSVVSYRTSGQDDAARRREGRQIEVIRHVEEAIQAVRLQQLAIRDYLLGDGEQALETVRVQRERRDRAMAEALEAGSALQNERLRRALAQAASWDA